MRIGIDARAYGWEGLGRYTRNILQHLTTLSSRHTFVVFIPRRFARDVASLPNVQAVPVSDSYYSLAEQTGFLHTLLRVRVDLMHFLHFNAPLLYRRPFVVTIHDLTRFFFPAQKRRGVLHQWIYEEVFRSSVLHAKHVITVSHHTRSDLLRFFPDALEKTTVIHEGIDHARFHRMPDAERKDREILFRLRIAQPYLLYVGVWLAHKNLPNLLRAFRILRDMGHPHRLVLTGKGRAHDEHVPRLVAELGLKKHVFLPGRINDEDLPTLYRRADVFLFPSLYEGFGLPPLEAIACGAPVVASCVASLPEVLGNAALFVDPYDISDIARGTDRLLQDGELRAELLRRGNIHVRQFDWHSTAASTLHVYERVMKNLPSPRVQVPTRDSVRKLL